MGAGVRPGGILLVCAANVCRSPMAALTLRRALEEAPGFADLPIMSAGVSVGGELGACPLVEGFHDGDRWQQLARAHRSRALDADEVAAASIVLTASRGIRSSVVAAVPDARRKVFTMREAVWLGADALPTGSTGTAAVAAFQAHIDGRRGLRQLPSPPRRWFRARRAHDPLDILDGHLSSAAAHRETVRAVDAAARALAALIAAPEPGR